MHVDYAEIDKPEKLLLGMVNYILRELVDEGLEPAGRDPQKSLKDRFSCNPPSKPEGVPLPEWMPGQ